MAVHVGFDTVPLGQAFLRGLSFSLPIIIPPMLPFRIYSSAINLVFSRY